MLAKLYEDPRLKLWRFNPCDYGAHRALHLLRAGFAHLSVDCRCCSGARVAAVAVAASFFPWATGAAIVALMAYGIVKEIRDPQYNYGPESEE